MAAVMRRRSYLQSLIQSTKCELIEKNQELEQASNEEGEKDQQLQQLRAAIETREGSLAQLQRELVEQKDVLEHAVRALGELKQQSQERQHNVQQAVQKCEAAVMASKANTAALAEAKAQLEEEHLLFEREFKEARKVQKLQEGTASKLQALKVQVRDKEAELRRMCEQEQRLGNEKNRIQQTEAQRKSDREHITSQIQALETRMEQLKEETRQLKTKLEQQSQAKADLEAKKKDAERHLMKVASAVAELLLASDTVRQLEGLQARRQEAAVTSQAAVTAQSAQAEAAFRAAEAAASKHRDQTSAASSAAEVHALAARESQETKAYHVQSVHDLDAAIEDLKGRTSKVQDSIKELDARIAAHKQAQTDRDTKEGQLNRSLDEERRAEEERRRLEAQRNWLMKLITVIEAILSFLTSVRAVISTFKGLLSVAIQLVSHCAGLLSGAESAAKDAEVGQRLAEQAQQASQRQEVLARSASEQAQSKELSLHQRMEQFKAASRKAAQEQAAAQRRQEEQGDKLAALQAVAAQEQSRLQATSEALSRARATAEQKQRAADAAEQKKLEFGEAVRRAEQASEQLGKLIESQEEMKKREATLKEDMRVAQVQIDVLNGNLAAAVQRLTQLDEELISLRSKSDETTKDLDGLKSDQRQAEQDLRDHSAKFENLVQATATLESQVRAKLRDVETKQKAAKEAEDNAARALELQTAAREACGEVARRCADEQRAHDERTSKNTAATRQLQDLQTETTSLRCQLTQAEQQWQVARDQLRNARLEFNKLDNKRSDFELKLRAADPDQLPRDAEPLVSPVHEPELDYT